MLAIEPLLPDPTGAAALAGAQAVLLTSAAAVGPLARATARRDLPVLAVGDATAAAAADAGFSRTSSADGDVRDLAALVRGTLDPAAGPLVHAAGARRAGDLAGMLAEAGFEVATLALYRAVSAERLPAAAAAGLAAGEIGYAAFFSPQTARTFARLTEDVGVADKLACVTAVAMSANVAAALAHLAWRRLLVAERPTAAALLAKLVAAERAATPG